MPLAEVPKPKMEMNNMRTQGCREMIDWVQLHCHGLSKDAVGEVKSASKFCKERAPYLELQTTGSVNAIRVIKDPIIQGKVLQMVKDALESKIDPRTGEKFKQNLVGVITTPMIKWMILYAETGEKPPYVPRGSQRKTIDAKELMGIMAEVMKAKEDRRTGEYIIPQTTMQRLVSFNEVLCKAVSQ